MTNYQLFIKNSFTREKAPFVPQRSPVSLYVCGITPYDYAHIGHGRCYVHFDVVVRLLRALGYAVHYVRNVTDIDDKLIAKAPEQTIESVVALARKYTEFFWQDMAALNTVVPDDQPTVSGHIPEIIAMIELLLAKGHAYLLANDVYFDISTYDSYGQLSNRDLCDMKSGARISVNNEKRNPGDFALWKGNDDGLFWSSPWGWGRPGWHIECSTFAQHYLGETIDIHGGGQDLLFPHHENERAQSECAHGKTFVRYWVHNAHVTLNDEKMSKSLGNFFTIRDICAKVDPMLLRFYFLQHHYRTPLDFDLERVQAVMPAYQKLVQLVQDKTDFRFSDALQVADALSHDSRPIFDSVMNALCDDFNTSKALGIIFSSYPTINQDESLKSAIVWVLQKVCGLSLEPIGLVEREISVDIKKLISQRDKARADKNWAEADRLRSELSKLGYEVVDKKIS